MTLFKPRVGKVIFAQTTGGLSVIIPILNNSQSHLATVHKLYQTINKRQTQLRAKWINGHTFWFNTPMHWTQALPEKNTVES